MKNKVEDLRDHLFATLEALRDKENPMDLERAKAIADVAQVIVNSAKVEIQAIALIGGKGSGFIPGLTEGGGQTQTPARPQLVKPRGAL